MKLSGYIIILLVVGLAFTMVGSVVNDLQEYYPNPDINTSWSTKYDISSTIDAKMATLEENTQTISKTKGWTQLAATIAAIPNAVTIIPAIMIELMNNGLEFITDIGAEIGIPFYILKIAGIALIVLIIFGIVSFLYRSKA